MLDKFKNFTKFTQIILGVLVIFAGIALSNYIYTQFFKYTLPSKVYRIALDETWYPLQLYEKDENVSLFSEEIVRAIASEEDFSVEFMHIGPSDLFTGLENGDYEGVLSSLDVESENAENYIFSNSYYPLGPVLATTISSPFKSLKDLKGKRIGVIRGSDSMMSLLAYGSADLVFYDFIDRFKMPNDMVNGVIDGVFLDVITAYEYINSGMNLDQFRVVSVPLGSKGLHFIALNNAEDNILIHVINKGLKKIQENGVYSQILSKWGLFNPEKSLK